MTEEFLQYIWKNSLFHNNNLIADTGERIHILNPGYHNTNAGPDFINASIIIDGVKWAGNVEIHINSSDWNKHKHKYDKAYDNVILHAVKNNNQITKRTSGEIIPTIELSFDKSLYNIYSRLISGELWISCQNEIEYVDKYTLDYWLNVMLTTRLERKVSLIYNTLEVTKNDWEETFYIHLARNFGLNINSLPFEILAKSISFKYLLRHKSSITRIEALLFGQAGFLNNRIPGDNYYRKLKKEYDFLKDRFQLEPMDHHMWKFLRLRPRNFPTVRLAQFAGLIYSSGRLFSKVIECESIAQLRKYFNVETSAYWNNHFIFGKKSVKELKSIGDSAFNIIVINTIIPFLFAYSIYKGKEELKKRSMDFYTEIPAEDNIITRKWGKLGIISKCAADSQALIQLKNNYCSNKECLNCLLGNKIIATR
jgi:hypothetical protein